MSTLLIQFGRKRNHQDSGDAAGLANADMTARAMNLIEINAHNPERLMSRIKQN